MSQPIAAFDQQAIVTAFQVLLSGEDQIAGRLYGGLASEKFLLTATGVPTNWIGFGRLISIRCLTAGTITGLYDNTSASGTNLMPAIAMIAGQVISFGGGDAVYFDTSPWFVLASGTYVVTGIN